ncbi:MAG: DNA-binding transcriptional regulator [Planctomycetota bacterium]|nr:MAG: DNA-binding transcriptional regulator [Planctomycetota bacterium]
MAEIPKIILRIETSVAYGRGLLYGIAKYSRIHGPWAFYSEPGAEQTALPHLDKWGASGIITRIPDEGKLDQLVINGLPAILIPLKEKIPDFPNIIDDCATAGRMAAEHLLDRGFRNFAFCGFSDMHWSRDRRENFTKRIAKAGFETQSYERPRAKVVCYYQKELRLLAEWLNLLPRPVGVMTCDDEHGRHAVEACKVAGLHVPEQVAIVGVDNDELTCTLSDPPLSSIAVNTRKAGYKAAALLDRLMTGREKMAEKKIIVRPLHVVTRQSTDVLAIKDREVAEAIRFIHRNAKRPIQVSDAADAAALSRRVLEKRFRKIMGRSVYGEINRQRIGHVAGMLVDTDQSISQIALSLGYPSVKHIARSFRREKGMSPLAYRKQYGFK